MISIKLSKDVAANIISTFNQLREIDVKFEFQTVDNDAQIVCLQIDKTEQLNNTVVISPKTIPTFTSKKVIWAGLQRHLVNHQDEKQLETKPIYLNKIKGDASLIELYFRQSHIVQFGLDSLKFNEECSDLSYPNGLTSENACQIARYAGISNSVNTFIISGFENIQSQTFQIIAELLWYFLEGFKNRFDDELAEEGQLQTLLIEHDALDKELVILKGLKSSRLWLQSEKKNYPISISEFEQMKNGSLPDRIILMLS